MAIKIVEGCLLDQPTEIIVNSWNRNFIPWWLLLPQGVSGAIKRSAGYQPFVELGKKGVIPLGGAVVTGAGKLAYQAIIHVAGINMFWFASEYSIRKSVYNALQIAQQKNYRSIAFPLIGAGTGGFSKTRALEIMQDEMHKHCFQGTIIIVKYKKNRTA